MPLGENYYNAVLDGMLGANATADWPSILYAALFTADPGYDDTGVEVLTSGTNYSRVAVDNDAAAWPAAVGGVKTLAEEITFPTSTSSWGTPQWIGFYTASTGGTLVWSSSFATRPRTAWPDVFSPKILAGTLTVSFWQLS